MTPRLCTSLRRNIRPVASNDRPHPVCLGNAAGTHHRVIVTVAACVLFARAVSSAPPFDPRLDGYVGGPYKVVAADFTGDSRIDVVVGFRNLGLVSVEHGDGSGGFPRSTWNTFPRDSGDGATGAAAWAEPHVHNITHGDLNGDGLPDLGLAVGGLTPRKPGRIIVARNAGDGRFEQVLVYTTPSQAKGVAFTDLDNDGRLDLLYTARGSGYEGDLSRGRLSVRRNLGDGKFGPAIESDAGKSAYYVETGDLNDDGFADIVVPNEHDTSVTYFLNPGPALFTADLKSLPGRRIAASPISGRRSHAINDVRAVDLTGDGHRDLLTANLGTSTVSIFTGNGDGTFAGDRKLDGGKNGAFLATGDFDGDGDTDFVITHWTEDFASILLNKGDGRFATRTDYETGSGNYGVAVADLNGDGQLDIVTANYRARSVSVLRGVGDGTFAPATTTHKGIRGYQGRFIRETAD